MILVMLIADGNFINAQHLLPEFFLKRQPNRRKQLK
jgi:hypothetical protein